MHKPSIQAERIDWKRGNTRQAVTEYLAWLEVVLLFPALTRR